MTVSAGTMTSSATPTPKAASAACRVVVPELKAMPYLTPKRLAKAASSRWHMLPLVELPKPESSTSLTYSISRPLNRHAILRPMCFS